MSPEFPRVEDRRRRQSRLPSRTGTASHGSAVTELNLLPLSVLERARMLNRDRILGGAHDRSWDPFDRSIGICISLIHRKIELRPAMPTAIRTVSGVGHIYDGQ